VHCGGSVFSCEEGECIGFNGEEDVGAVVDVRASLRDVRDCDFVVCDDDYSTRWGLFAERCVA
jgi:hypothetical protein